MHRRKKLKCFFFCRHVLEKIEYRNKDGEPVCYACWREDEMIA